MPILDAAGSLLGYRGVDKDITERKRTEAALLAEKKRAQSYLDVAGVMLVAVDDTGRITLMNRRGHEILGYKEGEITGQSWVDTCVPERMRNEARGVVRLLLAGGDKSVEYFENPVVTRSGEERLVAWHNVVLRDETGRTVGILISGDDITERHAVEAKLRESELKFRAIFDNASDGMFLVEPDSRRFLAGQQLVPADAGLLGR